MLAQFGAVASHAVRILLSLQIAQELLCSLLVQEQMQLAEAGDAAVATRGSSNGFPAAAALQELHEDVLQILAHHIKLCTTKHTRKHKHKKSESSKRSKRHKQQS